MDGPYPCLIIRGGKASECQAVLGVHGAEVAPDAADPDRPSIVPYSEMTEVWHYATFVHVRTPELEARFDVGDRRRAKRFARMIEDAPSPLEALGARAGDHVAVLGLPDGWVFRLLGRRRITGMTSLPQEPARLLIVGVAGRLSLPGLSLLMPYLRPDGALWVVYPRDDEVVRTEEVVAAGRGTGLTDVLELHVAPGRSALKFVAPPTAPT